MKKQFYKISAIITFAMVLSVLQLSARNAFEGAGSISMSGYVSDQIEGLPPISKSFLENKLGQIVTQNGITNGPLGSRFIITPNISVLTKDILPDLRPCMHLLFLLLFTSEMVLTEENSPAVPFQSKVLELMKRKHTTKH